MIRVPNELVGYPDIIAIAGVGDGIHPTLSDAEKKFGKGLVLPSLSELHNFREPEV